jgi:hypothetical protein
VRAVVELAVIPMQVQPLQVVVVGLAELTQLVLMHLQTQVVVVAVHLEAQLLVEETVAPVLLLSNTQTHTQSQ